MAAIRSCAARMDAHYGQTVFDEWVVVSLRQQQASILGYVGPRTDAILKHFTDDLGPLRMALLNGSYQVGDFEFARQGKGTKFEAFMTLGDGVYLICNNTQFTMDDIAKNPNWLTAQVPFAELSDRLRASPLVHPA